MSARVVFSRVIPRFLRRIGFGISAAAITSTTLWAADSGGIRVGFSRLPVQLADHGELLLGELNCVACHGADPSVKARLASRQAPLLGPAGLRVTPQYLRKLLSDPQAAKPGTTMPDLLQDLPAAERTAAIDSLVHFLVSTSPAAPAPLASDESKIQQGRLLYHQVGCVACHAPQEAASVVQGKTPPSETIKNPELLDPESIPLGDLARKTTVEALARFLKDPLKIRPSGRMPSLNLTDAETGAISMYLLRAQASSAADPNGPRPKTPGLAFQYYEGNFNETADLDKQKPKSSGLTDHFNVGDRKTKQNFGLRLTGVLIVPRDGNFTFYTDSDDGSRLFIDGQQVVENDAIHGPTEKSGSIELKAGDHPILVTYFNGGAGAELKVSIEGPGISKRQIPRAALYTYGGQPMLPLDREELVADPGKAARGKELFGSLGCVSCHAMTGITATAGAKSFATIANEGGCLAENPGKGLPKYALNSIQRELIQRTLARRADLAKASDPAAQVNRTMAAMNCFACHSRAGTGGPSSGRNDYFSVIGQADLGDEGRIPPHLTRVGDKLRPEWVREILWNKGASRPYMATRMPQFGERNIGHLPAAFEKADHDEKAKPRGDTAGLDAKFGRNLVGTGGLACISCHTFAPHKSLGIPAMDLTLMSKRLKEDWFHRYLLDPQSLRPGTRMPTFWPDGKSALQDILAGNTDRQINAIWAFLSRGKEAGLPPGLVQGKMELVATTEPAIYRHFIQGAGSRAIGVGYPEKANLAFDANDLRLALIWQGPFIDMARHRTGRGDGFEAPLGYNTIRMPPGPSFAVLENSQAKWPDVAGKKGGYQMHGYTFDEKRRPAFRYSYQQFEIEDAPAPVTGELDPFFRRTITVKADSQTENLWFLAWAGPKIEEQGGGVFLADGKLKLRFELPPGVKPILRQSNARSELLIPVQFGGKQARFVEEITW